MEAWAYEKGKSTVGALDGAAGGKDVSGDQED